MKSRMRLRHSMGVVAILLLSGCALAPGQYVTPSNTWFSDRNEPEIEVIPITPKLFAQQQGIIDISALLPADLLAYEPVPYRIGAGDTLSVTVWDHPELTIPTGTQFNNSDANGRLVRPDGSLYYPYINSIQAGGLTLAQLRTELARRLAEYIDAPQVDVAVLRFASQKVFISGAFKRTVPVLISTTPLSLADALGQAEIDTLEADRSGLVLTRDGARYRLSLDRLAESGQNPSRIFLRANDTLHLPYSDRRNVYVMGEVNRQLAVPFRSDGISLAEALSTANGMRQETSTSQSVYVIRAAGRDAVGPATTVYQLDANSVISLSLADRFKLQAGDVVYVGPAQITRFNRVINSLLPTAGLANTAARTGN